MRFQPIIPLLQRTIVRNRLTFNLRTPFPFSRLPPTRIQTANFVRVASLGRSDPDESFAVLKTYSLPDYVVRNEKKTWHFDVLLADYVMEGADDAADVCWRFEILEGEDVLERLLHYAQGFGKHGSGDDDFDEYVRAFHGKITGFWVETMVFKGHGTIHYQN